MNRLSGAYMLFREITRRVSRGQTMAEYALILAAVLVAAAAAYYSVGNTINTLVVWNIVDQDLLGL